jgi:hypothetical protein
MELKRELPDWIDRWLMYRDNSEAPIIFSKWVAISVIAAALERKIYLVWDKYIYANFYIVLVGPPACRKNDAMGPGRDILDEVKVKIAADATTKEKLADRLQEATDNFEGTEGLGLIAHSSLTIYSEEFTVFLGYGNQDIMPWLCDWYDCRKKWNYQTRHQGEVIVDNVWLNIIGATTPELLQAILPRESFGSGLNSRIIYVYADKKEKIVLFPFATDDNDKLYNKLLSDLNLIRLTRGECKPDESYLKRWSEWYPTQDKMSFSEDARMVGYIGRRPTHLHKLAMVMNVSRSGGLLLTEQDFNRALETLEEVESNMQRAFAGIGKSSTASVMNAVLSFLRLRGEVKYSELYNQFKYDADKQAMSQIVATLEGAKLIKITKIVDESDYMVSYIVSKKEE